MTWDIGEVLPMEQWLIVCHRTRSFGGFEREDEGLDGEFISSEFGGDIAPPSAGCECLFWANRWARQLCTGME